MNRRRFISLGLNAGLATAATLYGAKGSGTDLSTALPDLVAVRNGEPDAMLDAALKALGGMKTFVKPGQRVCIKPNIGWDKPPEMAANTNPALVRRAVEHCLAAGAREVVVFDHTCHRWDACYANSGIERAVKDGGGKMIPGNSEMYYQEVEIPGGVVLKTDRVHEAILESDVLINMPVIKNHRYAKMTISLKNLMGTNWDREYWHRTNLNQCIADFGTWCKPTLNIVDGYRIMLRNGPIGRSTEDVKLVKSLLVSQDMVAVDSAAVRIFGGEVSEVGYLGLAEELGLGTTNLDSLNIKRIVL